MVFVSLAVMLIGRMSWYTFWPESDLTDFDAFHLAGLMVWRGDIAEAYHLPTFMKVQRVLTGHQNFMPWTYPPPFDLVVALFALLPVGPSYLVFAGTTLAAYLLVLRRIAGPLFPAVLIALFPTTFIIVVSGQNGFLTGTLVGLTALGLMERRAGAGLPLGLMMIKPHLAIGLGLCALGLRRWACLALAVATAAVASLLATALLGLSIWPAFLRGVDEAATYLTEGRYPLFRMISVYASLRCFALPASMALAAQTGTALAALGLIAWAIWRRLPTRQVVGLAVIASLLVSPYAYDYDMSLYGIGFALLLPDLLARGSWGEHLLLLLLGWATGGYVFVMGALYAAIGKFDVPIRISLAGPLVLLMLVLISRILLREPRHSEAPAMPVGPIPV